VHASDVTFNPSTAVVVTNYNYGHLLPRVLASLATQTVPFDEVVVVDDGSVDDSRSYLAEQPIVPVRVLHTSRLGAARAKDHGIRATAAELVAIVDADDELHPAFLERCLSALRRDPSAAYVYTDVDNRGPGQKPFQAGEYDERRLFLEENYICTGVLMRRASYLRTPGFRIRQALEDWDLWLSFAEHGMRPAYVPEPLYVYHHHLGSRGTDSSETRLLGQWIKLRHPRLALRYLLPQLRRTARRMRRALG
jgi:glycosyltransferase involved in cell wall biosynthesis